MVERIDDRRDRFTYHARRSEVRYAGRPSRPATRAWADKKKKNAMIYDTEELGDWLKNVEDVAISRGISLAEARRQILAGPDTLLRRRLKADVSGPTCEGYGPAPEADNLRKCAGCGEYKVLAAGADEDGFCADC